MRNEILTGIFGGLVCIIIFVSIGSFIGKASSHGPKPTKAKIEKKADAKTNAKAASKTDAKANAKTDKKAAAKK